MQAEARQQGIKEASAQRRRPALPHCQLKIADAVVYLASAVYKGLHSGAVVAMDGAYADGLELLATLYHNLRAEFWFPEKFRKSSRCAKQPQGHYRPRYFLTQITQ